MLREREAPGRNPVSGKRISTPASHGRGPSGASPTRALLVGKSYAEQMALLSPRSNPEPRQDHDATRTPQSRLDPQAATPELLRFLTGPHEIANFQPSTGLGLFDARYDAPSRELVITMKCAFRFLGGDPMNYPGTASEDLVWDEDQKAKWRTGFIETIQNRWGGKHEFCCCHPGLESLHATTRVEVIEAEEDWHFRLDVRRIPKGTWNRSSVSALRGGQVERNHASLDSEDQSPSNKGGSEGQLGAVHEFGHMVGLDDEYGIGKDIAHGAMVKDALGREIEKGTSDDVMSCANRIRPQHYVTFLEALRKATGLEGWSLGG